ncbi:transglutaminase family protein [Algicella marina]|uniref:Transglutaminase family protein n=1 Tax=Algicella marina TaxID=2683284 RepID=A0A6P1T551_9RHOB|nr:transglutaminase family protein [Algicella marina]QHQ36813.1 transglutaminase family protein [Algicella marina]
MHLKIEHQSKYRFEEPIRYVVQSHRLYASNFEGQSVVAWDVAVEGAIFGQYFTDSAGDQVRTMTLQGPVDEIAISVTGEVITTDLSGVLRNHVERVPPLAYLRATTLTKADNAIAELARSVSGTGSQLDTAHALSTAISEAITYTPGVTYSHTSAAEALDQGQGVCQDHAHALIAAARTLDLPARYVSGYLYATADGKQHEAGHAWAEIHVDGFGWIGFDAANACCPDENYVRLGSGLDANHAAPIRGVTHGLSEAELEVTVAVAAAQQ